MLRRIFTFCLFRCRSVTFPRLARRRYLTLIEQMLWTVNIGIKRKISLMGLFSGALFVIMASVIRAIVISTVCGDVLISGKSNDPC